MLPEGGHGFCIFGSSFSGLWMLPITAALDTLTDEPTDPKPGQPAHRKHMLISPNPASHFYEYQSPNAVLSGNLKARGCTCPDVCGEPFPTPAPLKEGGRFSVLHILLYYEISSARVPCSFLGRSRETGKHSCKSQRYHRKL